jgi:hypothetical protein
MAEEKKYDDISPANESSIAGETTSAKVMPLYADERGYHEKDEGYGDQVVIRPIGMSDRYSSAEAGMNSATR